MCVYVLYRERQGWERIIKRTGSFLYVTCFIFYATQQFRLLTCNEHDLTCIDLCKVIVLSIQVFIHNICRVSLMFFVVLNVLYQYWFFWIRDYLYSREIYNKIWFWNTILYQYDSILYLASNFLLDFKEIYMIRIVIGLDKILKVKMYYPTMFKEWCEVIPRMWVFWL